ncbi:glycosyltransferase family 4 protein [Halobacterium litoreum]|uniref:Glycosyltransferase family 4 protein n=1 Tax=Halobacterium litoreum TaxID=2039234 RepID=A0ABD5NCJ3_9EURY|nr:glycosyltransferase family 4 protein [Halobacterium litoreum]UHH14402.1 glycosyltransferase family 4 protein [Halobacterium litoreum]
MKVLQLATTDSPFFAEQVRALEAAGVDCTVVTVPSPPDGRTLASFATFYRRVLRETLTGDYDVVHANYGLLGPLAFAQPVRPVVLTIWGSEVMGYSARLDAVTRAGIAAADAVVAPSRSVVERVESDTDLVPFGVDTERFRPMARDEARAELGWDADERVVLFPYDPDRAVKDFPRAERVVAETDATLRWISGVPHDRVPVYMNASDAVLVTSERESGPMVVKEAAACNVPVVSTDVGFAGDVLDGVAHSTVAATDRRLVDGLQRALAAGERADGREQIDALGLERMADGLRAVYQRELGHRGVEA